MHRAIGRLIHVSERDPWQLIYNVREKNELTVTRQRLRARLHHWEHADLVNSYTKHGKSDKSRLFLGSPRMRCGRKLSTLSLFHFLPPLLCRGRILWWVRVVTGAGNHVRILLEVHVAV